MLELVALLPWIALLVALPYLTWRRPRIRDHRSPPPERAPLVSVIVPARNEAVRIGACLATLLDSDYTRYEILVVDDRSRDGTGEIAEALAERAGKRVRVVHGERLPPGWVGKAWACWQGYQAARGELLLFTGADTRHDSNLLGAAVGASLTRNADVVSVLPGYPMPGFWHRVVLPHLWLALALRYPSAGRVNRTRRPAGVRVAGEFLLVRREAYEAADGHESVAGEILGAQRLTQRLHELGRRIYVAHGEEWLESRVYPSLGALVAGWSKNLATGARSTVDPWLRPYTPWLVALLVLALWVGPPAGVAASLVLGIDGAIWSASTRAIVLSLVIWIVVYGRLRAPLGHALLFPMGAVVVAWIFARSGWRRGQLTWKGRRYGAARPPG